MSSFANVVSQVYRRVQPQPIPPPPPRSPPPPLLSRYHSTPGVKDSAWASLDFMLGAGMVIIQRNTHKIVVVYDTHHNYWFFPRGRKDKGESLEQTALREAYEESGYRAQFLPLLNPTRQPTAPQEREERGVLNVEPVFMTLTAWQPRKRRNGELYDNGGEYLTTWYAGEIPEDAAPEIGTGMPDEQGFRSHLLPFEEAINKVWGNETKVLLYVWDIYVKTMKMSEVQQLDEQPDQTAASG